MQSITQMPIILLPLHFDVDPVSRDPHCQRSVVIRPFLTNDFMTGVAAQPGKDLPLNVGFFYYYYYYSLYSSCTFMGINVRKVKVTVFINAFLSVGVVRNGPED